MGSSGGFEGRGGCRRPAALVRHGGRKGRRRRRRGGCSEA
ncbi:unnamed protein product [Spirodela intermedia]|uniref:Uncharacterized protein n=1 Tax=Spirodela intermedia TaxID=51605 RepID=A0ABN7ECB9_SPIIN|nr:unnamed protein product [Spirodela intermedia]